MENITKIFYDFESTSIKRDADIISIGLVAITNNKIKTFYSEFTDFDINKCAVWVKENVVNKLKYKESKSVIDDIDTLNDNHFRYKGNTEDIAKVLKQWLSQFESIEFWADYDNKDRTYLQEIIGDWSDYMNTGIPIHLPNIQYYDFYDIHTLFKIKGFDVDFSRELFSNIDYYENLPNFLKHLDSHNSLFDAYVSYLCYNKLKNE